MLWHKIKDLIAKSKQKGCPVEIWWRDDDAISMTASLEQLLGLSEKWSAPLSLAVIPEPCNGYFPLPDKVSIIQHGIAHINHAKEGKKKSEFPEDCEFYPRNEDILFHKKKLKKTFGNCFVPIFVPPWNRIAPNYIESISDCGFSALSRFGKAKQNIICELNTHIDIVNNKTRPKTLINENAILEVLANEIEERIHNTSHKMPIGLLTHHLVHDSLCWRFLDNLLAFLNEQEVLLVDVKRWLSNASV